MPRSIIWKPAQILIQTWDGADAQLQDRVSFFDIWRGPYSLCVAAALLRGTFGTGARQGWVVTGSALKREAKGIGTLRISWEPGGPYGNPNYLPLDEFKEEKVELYPKVERNKALYGPAYPGNPDDCIAGSVIEMVRHAAYGLATGTSSSFMTQVAALASRDDTPPTGSNWADQARWANILLNWLQRGHETYYMAGVKTSYIRHYFTIPTLSLGGFIQSPLWGPRAGDTTCSWLRLADDLEPIGVNGSAYKITYTWLGGPGGHWDTLLYST